MIVQLWNTNTSAFVSCDADLTENYMYISMKFGTGVHVFCWEVGVFNRSSFQSASYNLHHNFEPFEIETSLLTCILDYRYWSPCKWHQGQWSSPWPFKMHKIAFQTLLLPGTFRFSDTCLWYFRDDIEDEPLNSTERSTNSPPPLPQPMIASHNPFLDVRPLIIIKMLISKVDI